MRLDVGKQQHAIGSQRCDLILSVGSEDSADNVVTVSISSWHTFRVTNPLPTYLLGHLASNSDLPPYFEL